MSETPTHTSPAYAGRRVTSATVVLAWIVATLAALIGTFAVAQVALAAGASDELKALTPGAYGFFTAVGTLAGLVGWLLIRRRENGAATLRWLVPTVLVVSLVPDVMVGFSDQAGASWGAAFALMVMHVVVTVAAVVTFARMLPVSRTTA
jgi:hypothetical protein